MKHLSIKLEIIPGTNFDEAAFEALRFHRMLGINVSFEFNGAIIYVDSSSDIKELRAQFDFQTRDGVWT